MTARLLTDAPARTDDTVVLDYDQRLMRRKLLTTARGRDFMVSLPGVTNLDGYWGFELPGPLFIRIDPAPEAVLVVTGDLTRLAWHIGNRHTPCQILPDRLMIREDHVLERMLTGLGATISRASLPFRPEGGAYGHGRTMGHSHGEDEHSHALEPSAATFGWHDHGDGKLHFHAPPKVAR
ncbi:MAG: urease accessory protein UreE [Proteobacteria bacterium]|nr:urease accessory protein UreE [Pseudomonadota bacterium]